MKKLEDITTDLELSKELKEKGFPQDSLFYYAGGKKEYLCLKPNQILNSDVSALTTEEILKELPHEIKGNTGLLMSNRNFQYPLQITKCFNGKYEYFDIRYGLLHGLMEEKLCNAVGKMYKYLADKNLLGEKQCRKE